MSPVIEEIKLRQAEAETWSAAELVDFGLQRFSPRIAIASSFGAEDVVLIDLAAQIRPDFRVFTLDTDFLFPETYALIDDLERRHHIKVERTRPRLTPEGQAQEFGAALWSRKPDQCCTHQEAQRSRRLDHGYPSRPGPHTSQRAKARLGRQVWAG